MISRVAFIVLGVGIISRVLAADIPPMPQAITNNAVVSVRTENNEYLISFSGLGKGRTHADTLDVTWVYDSNATEWHQAPDVPGGVGRLASVAASVGDKAYVFGGYSVAEDGSEVSAPWAHRFDPVAGEFEEVSPMPVPVDDAVAVTFRNRYIYLISGWHDLGNVNLVQRYDTLTNLWVQATPTPGPAVFGHAGGIAGNKLVYCDGVAVQANADRGRDFVANGSCYLGIIDSGDSRRIDWRVLKSHQGLPRYRAAAAGDTERGGVWFVGGSENPYNYNGIGYNGEPSEPLRSILFFDIEAKVWVRHSDREIATMDHRGLVPFGDAFVTIGGMHGSQEVTGDVHRFSP
jgi:hypothetical protein